jgi:PAS domain S-box-containing protein
MLQGGTTGLSAEILRMRARELYRVSGDATQGPELLGRAIEELELALEALQGAEDRLRAMREEHLNDRAALEQSLEHYRDLFVHAPLGYLATNPEGIVRQANARAEALLGTRERGLVGRSLSNFIPDGQRRKFRTAIAEHLCEETPRRWETHLEPWQGEGFDAILYSVVARAPSGRPQALRWLVCSAADEARLLGDASAPTNHQWTNRARREGDGAPADVAQLFATIAEAGALTASSGDVSDMLASVAHLLVPQIADGCIVDIDDRKDTKLRFIVTSPSRMLEADGDGAGAALGIHDPNADGSIRMPDDVPRRNALRALIGALGPRSAIVSPLEAGGNIIGSLTLIRSTPGRRYGSVEVALCEELVRRLVAGIERIQSSAVRAQG